MLPSSSRYPGTGKKLFIYLFILIFCTSHFFVFSHQTLCHFRQFIPPPFCCCCCWYCGNYSHRWDLIRLCTISWHMISALLILVIISFEMRQIYISIFSHLPLTNMFLSPSDCVKHTDNTNLHITKNEHKYRSVKLFVRHCVQVKTFTALWWVL